MIQDRIGPNRATIYVPGWLLKIVFFLMGAALAAMAAIYSLVSAKRPDPVRLDAGFGMTELAIFLVWFGLVLVRGRARQRAAKTGITGALSRVTDARPFFY